jgi:homoserine dehydrogenase
VREVTGVLNGTTNFVLDAIAAGATFDEAVAEAQRRGFAEADPTTDLDGSDAAAKLVLVAHAAFGARVEPAHVRRRGILGVDPADVRAARAEGGAVRLVARCGWSPEGVTASVEPERLPAGHPLADVAAENNRVCIETDGGTITLDGRGAGRWPTASAVVSDLALLCAGGAP